MTDFRIHTLTFTSDTQQGKRGQQNVQQALAAVLGSGTPQALPTGSDPSRQTVSGLFRGTLADSLMTALQELTANATVEAVAFFGKDSSTQDDGYYALSDVEPTQIRPETRNLWSFDLTMRRKGSRKTHWRAVTTAPTQPSNGTDFGNDTTGYIGIDSRTTRVRWFEPESANREDPTLVATRNSEFGDVEIYDTEASSFDQPVLIGDLAYDHEGKVDSKVWDTLGNASKLDGDSNLQWARVFDPGRVPEGDLVVENGLLRLTFDESTPELTAEDWNDGTSSWDAVSLGSSDWELFDVDVQTIGMATVRAYVEFRDPTTSPDSFYTLDMVLGRGQEDASWFVPANEGDSTPSGLQTKLDPIADTTVVDPQPSSAVTERSEVRK